MVLHFLFEVITTVFSSEREVYVETFTAQNIFKIFYV